MRDYPHSVTLTQLPDTLDTGSWLRFFKELEDAMRSHRPRIILDCSNLRQMDRNAIHILLCCLEEALKRDGNVKLAAISSSAREALEAMRVDHLFEIYDTSSDAINSFLWPPCAMESHARGPHVPSQLSLPAI